MKAKNVLKVIQNLEKVLPFAKMHESLDMSCGQVSCEKGENLCGTTQCHGGWYAVSTFSAKTRMSRSVDYYEGAEKMGMHLGFKSTIKTDANEKLEDWAENNPEIWGNDFGQLMFCSEGEKAFYNEEKRPYGATCLQDIVDHWKEVYARLLALENPEEKREDITAKLAILPVDEVLDSVKVEKQVLVYE